MRIVTGLPAAWSADSVLVRLALGAHFDPQDLFWYAAGVLPLMFLHERNRRRGHRVSSREGRCR